MIRIIVTGSREWHGFDQVRDHLDRVVADLTAGCGPQPVTLRHGAARGVDTVAARHATHRGWVAETYRADWAAPCRPTCRPGHRGNRYGVSTCPAAGHYRNQAMVDAGGDVCVAFVRNHSAGATDCMRRAKAAGIEVVAVFDCRCHPPALF